MAAARLAAGTGRPVRFVCRFGNDSHAAALEAALVGAGVDVSGCTRAALPSGQGLVLLEPDGTASSVVVGGANTAFKQVGRSLCMGLGDAANGCRGRGRCGFLGGREAKSCSDVQPQMSDCSRLPASLPAGPPPQGEALGHVVRGAGAVLLQREVPEHVNEAVAAAAAATKVPVLLVGGRAGVVGRSTDD